MAKKENTAKHVWSDNRKKAQSSARVRRDKRKAERIAAQKHREGINKELKRQGDLTAWEIAKAARAERREGMPQKERTALGNIIEKGEDGIKRVRPGSKREVQMALQIRQAEAEREAAARAETKKRKTKKEKAA